MLLSYCLNSPVQLVCKANTRGMLNRGKSAAWVSCRLRIAPQQLSRWKGEPALIKDFLSLNIYKGGGTTATHNSFMNVISAWCRRAQIPHRGGTSGTPRTCKGMFST